MLARLVATLVCGGSVRLLRILRLRKPRLSAALAQLSVQLVEYSLHTTAGCVMVRMGQREQVVHVDWKLLNRTLGGKRWVGYVYMWEIRRGLNRGWGSAS